MLALIEHGLITVRVERRRAIIDVFETLIGSIIGLPILLFKKILSKGIYYEITSEERVLLEAIWGLNPRKILDHIVVEKGLTIHKTPYITILVDDLGDIDKLDYSLKSKKRLFEYIAYTLLDILSTMHKGVVDKTRYKRSRLVLIARDTDWLEEQLKELWRECRDRELGMEKIGLDRHVWSKNRVRELLEKYGLHGLDTKYALNELYLLGEGSPWKTLVLATLKPEELLYIDKSKIGESLVERICHNTSYKFYKIILYLLNRYEYINYRLLKELAKQTKTKLNWDILGIILEETPVQHPHRYLKEYYGKTYKLSRVWRYLPLDNIELDKIDKEIILKTIYNTILRTLHVPRYITELLEVTEQLIQEKDYETIDENILYEAHVKALVYRSREIASVQKHLEETINYIINWMEKPLTTKHLVETLRLLDGILASLSQTIDIPRTKELVEALEKLYRQHSSSKDPYSIAVRTWVLRDLARITQETTIKEHAKEVYRFYREEVIGKEVSVSGLLKYGIASMEIALAVDSTRGYLSISEGEELLKRAFNRLNIDYNSFRSGVEESDLEGLKEYVDNTADQLLNETSFGELLCFCNIEYNGAADELFKDYVLKKYRESIASIILYSLAMLERMALIETISGCCESECFSKAQKYAELWAELYRYYNLPEDTIRVLYHSYSYDFLSNTCMSQPGFIEDFVEKALDLLENMAVIYRDSLFTWDLGSVGYLGLRISWLYNVLGFFCRNHGIRKSLCRRLKAIVPEPSIYIGYEGMNKLFRNIQDLLNRKGICKEFFMTLIISYSLAQRGVWMNAKVFESYSELTMLFEHLIKEKALTASSMGHSVACLYSVGVAVGKGVCCDNGFGVLEAFNDLVGCCSGCRGGGVMGCCRDEVARFLVALSRLLVSPVR